MNQTHEIIIFYKYTPIADPERFMRFHKELCILLRLTGRVLIAKEGINGTLEGKSEALRAYEARMHEEDGSEGTHGNFSDVWFKHSPGTGNAFPKLKVKVRDEIVTLGLGKEGDIDPNQVTGTHIKPALLKEWIAKGEDVTIIDMRNGYEYNVGHFAGSINPKLDNFRDLAETLPKLEHLKEKKVLTVCTYGVRCEKASGFLKQQGFKDVYQLDGGIGTYMKQYPGEDFNGSLFVFDNRMLERFTDKYEVVGVCERCNEKSEELTNCTNADCHRKIIVCLDCKAEDSSIVCKVSCANTVAAV